MGGHQLLTVDDGHPMPIRKDGRYLPQVSMALERDPCISPRDSADDGRVDLDEHSVREDPSECCGHGPVRKNILRETTNEERA